MLRHFIIVFIVSFLALSTGSAQADEGIVGTILEVEGSGTVVSARGQASAAMKNRPVHLDDTVRTAAASRVFILFIDDTRLTLSENTSFRIDNYVFDPDDNRANKAAYSALAGAFQYVSGLIGKKENPDVHIDTPVGALGIRGTDFWAGKLDEQYGLAVNDGQVALRTDAGEEIVSKGQGTSVRDRHSRPLRAQAWSPERFQHIFSTVHLRRHEYVLRRIAAIRSRQNLLRQRYKAYMARHAYFNDSRGGPSLRMENRVERQRTRPRGHRGKKR